MPDFLQEGGLSKEQLQYDVKSLWELESMVRALDCIETLASLAHLTRTYVITSHHVICALTLTDYSEPAINRDLMVTITTETRALKTFIKPVLKWWLDGGIGGCWFSPTPLDYQILNKLMCFAVTEEFTQLRRIYLPETVLAYISSLHFAGTTATRDNLMECMELAAQIADKEGDVAAEFVKAGRMKELVEAFASASKALAIWTGEKKASAQANTKKNREMGWSRELWSIKH